MNSNGKAAFMRRGELLRGIISKDLKKRTMKALVWNVVQYGSATWTLEKKMSNVYKLLRCGSGTRCRRSAGQHMCQMKKF